MKDLMIHILKFVGLLAVMDLLTWIPFGIFVNAVIVFYSLWKLVK